MAPRNNRSSVKRNMSPESPDVNAKKPRRSQRNKGGSTEDKSEETVTALGTSKEAPKEEALPTPQEHTTHTPAPSPPARTPASSPPPHTQDATQAASQFYFPPLAEEGLDKKEVDESVWGYLWPLSDKSDSVIKLNKQAPAPDKKKKKKGTTKGKKIPPNGFLVGRHAECDLLIDDAVISNRHCVIFKEISGNQPVAVLEDLSSNGTWVGGVIVGRNNRRVLKTGDEVEFAGGKQYIFRYPMNMRSSAFHDTYDLGEQLGSGHFATVHKAVEKKSGQEFAVKVFSKRRNDDSWRTSGVKQEIAVLMSVSHQNVLCLQGNYDEDDGVYLVLELAPEGELFNHIIRNGKLSEDDTRKIFIQLFNGLKYLHDRGIAHRDIKPENILLMDKNLTVKLADFGLAKIIGEDSFTTSLCGTPSYVAPEILQSSKNRRYSHAVDIWSLGVVLYISLCGFPPFSDELHTPQYPYTLSDQIKDGRFDFPSPYWDSIPDPALELIEQMLTVDPEKRITVDKALKHPWITGYSIDPNDSCASLTETMETLQFTKRRVNRERTLLADAPGLKRVADGGKWKGKAPAVAAISEEGPTENPAESAVGEKAFMRVGGKGGDETLYGSDYEGNGNEEPSREMSPEVVAEVEAAAGA